MPSLTDLAGFYKFIGARVENGETTLSPEQALDEWRQMYPEQELSENEIADIEEALIARENGEVGIPFEEFDRAFRARHQMPPRS